MATFMTKSPLLLRVRNLVVSRSLSSQSRGNFRPSGNRRGGGRKPPPKSTRILTDYKMGHRGTRPNTMVLFPGDFSDTNRTFRKTDNEPDPFVDDDEEKLREYLIEEEKKKEANKQRLLRNWKPKVWLTEIDTRGRSYGRGGRKRAQARVWMQPGLGEVVVNRRVFTDYFQRLSDRNTVLEPLVATETCGKFDLQCIVKGGGVTGQAGAIRLGVARALNAYNPDLYRPPLKFLGYLTRDSRKVERKVVGRVKARKRPQWVRR